MLKMEIRTGGAAFCNPYTGEPNEYCEAMELKRIIAGVVEDLDHNQTHGSLFDINGNKVGQWSR